MKKLIVLLLTILLIFSAIGCDGKKDEDKNNNESPSLEEQNSEKPNESDDPTFEER